MSRKESVASEGRWNEDREYMTPQEAAEYTGVNPTTLWRARKKGLLKVYGPTRAIIFYRKSELDAWMMGER